MESKYAELLHETLTKECKSEDEIKLETLRHNRHIDIIKLRQEERDNNRAMAKEDTAKHIAWAEQDNRERGHC